MALKTIPRVEAPPAVDTATDEIVEQWFQELFRNQGVETAFYNRAYAAKNDLKSRLNVLHK